MTTVSLMEVRPRKMDDMRTFDGGAQRDCAREQHDDEAETQEREA